MEASVYLLLYYLPDTLSAKVQKSRLLSLCEEIWQECRSTSKLFLSLSLRRELLQMTRLTPSSVLNRLISNHSEGYSFISGWISLNYMPIIITVTTRTGWLCFCGSYDNISVSRNCFFKCLWAFTFPLDRSLSLLCDAFMVLRKRHTQTYSKFLFMCSRLWIFCRFLYFLLLFGFVALSVMLEFGFSSFSGIYCSAKVTVGGRPLITTSSCLRCVV